MPYLMGYAALFPHLRIIQVRTNIGVSAIIRIALNAPHR